MITVLFFAQVREEIGRTQIQLTDRTNMTTESIRQQLSITDTSWQQALEKDNLLVAVNQTLSDWETSVRDGDEIAFFPPITGG